MRKPISSPKWIRIVTLAAVALGMSETLAGANSGNLSFVGTLTTTSSGAAYNGAVDISVTLFDAASAGGAHHSECFNNVSIVDGQFALQLGSITAFSPSLGGLMAANPSLFTEIMVCDPGTSCATGCDAPLAPRLPLTAVPYAAVAAQALDVNGQTIHPAAIILAPTGTLTLGQDPTTAMHAATKQYVDARVAGISGGSGSAGAPGSTGSVGATGASGLNGTTGSNGMNGNVGATGASGTNGTNGATGAIGATGASGAVGATGAGATGASGAVGATGASGANGVTGAGYTGVSGVTGISGAAGSSGATGGTGGSGATGVTGASPWNLSGANAFYSVGNIGIGTSAPAALLHVLDSSSSSTTATLENTGAGTPALLLKGPGHGYALMNQGSSGFQIQRDGTPVFTLDFGGRIGSGTTSPGAQVHAVATGGAALEADVTNSGIGGNLVLKNTDTTVGNSSAIQAMNSGGTNVAGINFVNVNAAPAQGALALQTGNGAAPITRLYLDPFGNVGVGTTAPSSPLHVVSSSTGSTAVVENSGTSGAELDLSSTISGGHNYALVSTASSGTFQIYDNTAAAPRFVISPTGRVGIGTSSPSAGLDVQQGGFSVGSNSLSSITAPTGTNPVQFLRVCLGQNTSALSAASAQTSATISNSFTVNCPGAPISATVSCTPATTPGPTAGWAAVMSASGVIKIQLTNTATSSGSAVSSNTNWTCLVAN